MVKRVLIMFTFLLTAVVLLLASDVVSSQIIYAKLDTASTSVGYLISKNGGINDSIVIYVKKELDADINCLNESCEAVKKGDTYFYEIKKKYFPIILKSGEDYISIKRSVVIGLYV